MINIRGLKDNIDPNYRYKMNKINIEKERNTYICNNIKDIAKDLNRDVNNIIIYIKKKIGINIIYKNDKAYIIKQISEEEIQKIIYEYIENKVLCKRCANPETYIIKEKKEEIKCCKSCNYQEIIL